MDCRRLPRFIRLLWLPNAVLFAAGCVSTTQQLATAPPAQVAVETRKQSDLPKITPKASSCVAGAELLRVEANAEKYTPAQRDEFRGRARKGYEQALRIEPNNAAALLGLARLYFDMGDHDHAVATYQKAVKHDPKN